LFVLIVLARLPRLSGFSISSGISYIKGRAAIVPPATRSSETVLPAA